MSRLTIVVTIDCLDIAVRGTYIDLSAFTFIVDIQRGLLDESIDYRENKVLSVSLTSSFQLISIPASAGGSSEGYADRDRDLDGRSLLL